MKRIQRKRIKGWRMPLNTVYVGRPTKWGNPFKIGKDGNRQEVIEKYRSRVLNILMFTDNHYIDGLRSKDLACWCPLDEPCHADILIEILRYF